MTPGLFQELLGTQQLLSRVRLNFDHIKCLDCSNSHHNPGLAQLLLDNLLQLYQIALMPHMELFYCNKNMLQLNQLQSPWKNTRLTFHIFLDYQVIRHIEHKLMD